MKQKQIEWPSASEGDQRRLAAVKLFLNRYPFILMHLFREDKPEMYNDREAMLDRITPWSSGEQILAKVAIDIWFHDDHPSAHVMDIARRLDDTNFDSVMAALKMVRNL